MPTGNWLPETFKIKTKPIYFLTKAEIRRVFFQNQNFERNTTGNYGGKTNHFLLILQQQSVDQLCFKL